MNKQEKQQIRLKVWQKLKNVALPDSRFHLNFEEYIPDFKDSVNAHDQIIKSEEYKKSKLLFITPDNCLTTIREQAIKDDKDIIVSTYGIYRGLILITKNMVNKGNEVFASTLDGLEHFGKNISLKEIKNFGVSRIIYTDINRDGTKQGPNIKDAVELSTKAKIPLVISGGVSSLEDIKKIKSLSNSNIEGVIIGKAIYDGDIKINDLAKLI